MKKAQPPKSHKLTIPQLLLVRHLKELFPQYRIHTEFRFNPDKKWKFDVCIPANNWAMECDGGAFSGGHRRGTALEKDYDRQNWAIANGWKLFRFSNRQILQGLARQWIAENLLGDKR